MLMEIVLERIAKKNTYTDHSAQTVPPVALK